MEGIELKSVKKTKELLVETNAANDLDEIKILLKTISTEKSLDLQMISKEIPNLFVLSLSNNTSTNNTI